MDDNLYPNDGTHYEVTVPEEQKREETSEKAKAQAGRELLTELIKRWEERIRFYDSLNSIDVDVADTPEKHQLQVLANKQTKANLLTELDYLEGLKQQHIDS